MFFRETFFYVQGPASASVVSNKNMFRNNKYQYNRTCDYNYNSKSRYFFQWSPSIFSSSPIMHLRV